MPRVDELVPTEAEIRQRLIDTALEYKRTTGMSFSAIGKAALNDTAFLFRVQRGEDFSLKSYRRLTEYFQQNWPADTVPVAE